MWYNVVVVLAIAQERSPKKVCFSLMMIDWPSYITFEKFLCPKRVTFTSIIDEISFKLNLEHTHTRVWIEIFEKEEKLHFCGVVRGNSNCSTFHRVVAQKWPQTRQFMCRDERERRKETWQMSFAFNKSHSHKLDWRAYFTKIMTHAI